MTRIRTREGIELAYESLGPEDAPAVILIMGLGAQMHVWPTSLCNRLVEAGYRVIRFDNRDTGRSTALDDHGNPSLIRVWLGRRLKRNPKVPYTLKDMSRDVLALMNELDIPSAHLVGASMGGMIAQILAAQKRKRVRSLTSIMSSASAPRVPVSQLQVMLKLARRPLQRDREEHFRYIARMSEVIGSPGYPMSDKEIQRLAETSWERTSSPMGFKRQLVAITHAGDRRRLLQKIKARTLVIHGADDPLIPVTMGIETASLIRKAKLRVITGMGHDFPEALVPRLSRLLIKHLSKAEQDWQKKISKKRSGKQKKTEVQHDLSQIDSTQIDSSGHTDPVDWLEPLD